MARKSSPCSFIRELYLVGALTSRPDISETEAIRQLQSIGEVWDHLFPAEQARIAHALIERITVRKDEISIKWHTKGMPKILRDSVMQPIYREAA